MKQQITLTLLTMLLLTLVAQAADDMQAFPPPEHGMKRYVLHLPGQEDESLFQVELIVGKIMELDTENRYFFGGKIAAQTIQGWGYTRYVVEALGPLAGTLMAVDPDAAKAERFIQLGGEPYLIRYNSRLPVVVYVPAAAEVRYRIWSVEPGMSSMNEG